MEGGDDGGETDTQTDMLPGIPESAICVQRFDDSLNFAIHTTYRISLRSSSLREPRHPLLRVVLGYFFPCLLKMNLEVGFLFLSDLFVLKGGEN